MNSSINFSWNSVNGAENYNLQIALQSDPAFSAPILDQTLPDLTYVYRQSLASGRYIWRARAVTQDKVGPWSSVSSFSVKGSSPPLKGPSSKKPTPRKVTSPDASCISSSGAWKNKPFSFESGSFEIRFDAVPNSAGIDGVIGLSAEPAADYTSLTAIVRFNTNGKIDARDGGAYSAVSNINYIPGANYRFRLVVNIPARAYDAYGGIAGKPEQLIGKSLAFRTEQNTASVLYNLNFYSSIGAVSVCDFDLTVLAAAPLILPAPPSANPIGANLISDDFNSVDSLLTNEFAYWNPSDSSSVKSSKWEMTSGSLFLSRGTAWSGAPDDKVPTADSCGGLCTNSAVFRLTTKGSFKDVSVKFKLLNQGLGVAPSTPAVDWDGVHVFLRYQSQYHLYYASINRRDNKVVIKKKVPGGSSNSGTYYTLSAFAPHAVPYGAWENVNATVQNNSDGTVTIKLYSNGVLVVSAIDTGIGGAPITAPGKVGIRGDNDNFKVDDFEVRAI